MEYKIGDSVAPALEEVTQRGLTCVIHTPNKEDAICVVGKIPSSSPSTTSNEWLECWDIYEENTCYSIIDGRIDSFCNKVCFDASIEQGSNYLIYEFSTIEALPQKDDTVRGKNDDLEPADSKLRMADGTIIGDFELPTATETKERIERARRKLEDFAHKFYTHKEEKKMPTKFTFYVTEGTRVDKSCNGTIPTMITTVEANSYSRTAPVGTATCDKADYDMRQGVLEALANMYCDGDFDKVYNKAVKRNELVDKKKRTCTYCGKVFDTVEEKQAEEAWHIERKKARRERYLLRKRAKEIAFEEQAQKMAKEMMGEQK